MSIRIGTGLSTSTDVRAAALEAGVEARAGLGGSPCELAVVFASGAHLAAPEATLEAVHEALAPDELIGCGAGGVIGADTEVEDGTAISIWAAHLDAGGAETFHAAVEELDEGAGALTGMPDLEGADAAVLLADPATFPTDAVLRFVSESTPTVPMVGGLASGRTTGGGAALFRGDEVLEQGAVGVRLDGVEVLPCVSQGAAPIGPELTITAADGNIIDELAGRPALEKLRETIESLPPEDLRLVQGGLLMGIVVDSEQARLRAGRLPGARAGGRRPGDAARSRWPPTCTPARWCGCTPATRPARTAISARRSACGWPRWAAARRRARSCSPATGAAARCSPCAHHDAEAVATALGGAPSAGFFAAGEIGPVGGESFLHGFTATVAVFA